MRRFVPWALVLVSASSASSDEVHLRGGGKLSGRILSATETGVVVEMPAGNITVPRAQVERVVEGRSALETYGERAASLAPDDREGWAELGRWASNAGLNTQSRAAWGQVLALDPADPEANEALGNVEVNGRWLAEEDAYRAQGYVKHLGEWMTPAERDELRRDQQQSGSEMARLEAEARARREAEAEAREAEERAREAEEEQQEGLPLWWGWGPGPVLWPGQPVTRPERPLERPRPRSGAPGDGL